MMRGRIVLISREFITAGSGVVGRRNAASDRVLQREPGRAPALIEERIERSSSRSVLRSFRRRNARGEMTTVWKLADKSHQGDYAQYENQDCYYFHTPRKLYFVSALILF
jgi:hypothetical protein